ncbi:shikimate kinase AroK [Thiohalophilus thiocyanatoxydans]|nr:shikimate kinase AroK [Thiohalophilus thiocyanatoxydans]
MSSVNNIFLVGLMGAGKTTIGRQLAQVLDKEFIDSDHEIEARTGVNIPLIFELEGEAGFREREAAMLDELTGRENVVLATGGGAVLREENRRHLKQRGTVVYLQTDVTQLLERTRKDKNRPLLQTDDPQARLTRLLQEREPLYLELADLVVNTGQGNIRGVVDTILEKLA